MVFPLLLIPYLFKFCSSHMFSDKVYSFFSFICHCLNASFGVRVFYLVICVLGFDISPSVRRCFPGSLPWPTSASILPPTRVLWFRSFRYLLSCDLFFLFSSCFPSVLKEVDRSHPVDSPHVFSTWFPPPSFTAKTPPRPPGSK